MPKIINLYSTFHLLLFINNFKLKINSTLHYSILCFNQFNIRLVLLKIKKKIMATSLQDY